MNHAQRNAAPMPHAHVRRVLQALRAHREPGWNLPAHFLGLVYDELLPGRAVVSMPLGSHLHAADGCVSVAALCVLADVAMAAPVRESAGRSSRLITVSARLSFGHRPADGRILAAARQVLSVPASGLPMAVGSMTMSCNGVVCCTGEASFAVLDNRRGVAAHPLPRTDRLTSLEPLSPSELDATESVVHAHAQAVATRLSPSRGSFLEDFWGYEIEASPAQPTLRSGAHVGNRVGDLQGGVLLGFAARASAAALAGGWHLMDLSAQFLAAGKGPRLQAKAQVVRQGRHIAVVDVQVTDGDGHVALTTQASFVREASAAADAFAAKGP